MDSIIMILISSLIMGSYVIYQKRRYQKAQEQDDNGPVQELYPAEAGTTKHKFGGKNDLMYKVRVNTANIKFNEELEYFVIKNNCMKLRGISDGDIIGVRRFHSEEDVRKNAKNGKILLIRLNDENFNGYKVREQGDLTENGNAYITYHYKDGKRTKSSRAHAISSIEGVVVEVHNRTQSFC